MNVENILELADAIENAAIPDLGFNMATYGEVAYDAYGNRIYHDHSGHNCGTVACIAGWVSFLTKSRATKDSGIGIYSLASDHLGLCEVKADELFLGFNDPLARDLHEITQEQAVRTLRHLAKTGEVDWAIGDTEWAEQVSDITI